MARARRKMQLAIGSTDMGRELVNSYGGMGSFMSSYGVKL